MNTDTNKTQTDKLDARDCEVCGAPTSFERYNPKIEPSEGEWCKKREKWVCRECALP